MLPSETMLETWRQRKKPTHGHHVSKLSFGQLHGGGGGGGGLQCLHTVIMAWSKL